MENIYNEAELIETLPAPAKEAIANANLPASKAASIVAVFKPCMEELNGFTERLEGIFNQTDITEQLSRDAKRLRLDIVKVRVAGDKVRKAAKEESLRYGQAIDGVYKFIALAASGIETFGPSGSFGIMDVGIGMPELGRIKLSHLASIVGPNKQPVMRDRYFQAVHPLSEYLRLAQENGSIID